jgi:hypothetical protein
MLRSPAAHEVVELRPSIGAQVNDLAVENCALRLDASGQSRAKGREGFKHVSFPRDQAHDSGFEMGQRPKAVVLNNSKSQFT